MGRLRTIELENFKSYAGYQSIGPFKSFQSIVGPNGAGKSNLMDAISFVLGVKSRHLRSHKLGDLVFRADAASAPAKRRASVKLVYVVDAEDSVEGVQDGDEIHFMRTIAASGVGSYRINGQEVTWEAYDKCLRQIGVLTKARNFLVFQGDVESVASKTPKELTALIEQISGSEDFRDQYEELKKQKEQAEENTIFTLQKRKGYAAEKKQVREQKEEAERYHAKLKELADTQREYFLFQLFHIDKEVTEHEEVIDELEEARGEAAAREATAEQNLKAAKKQHAKLNQALTKSEKAVHEGKSALEKLEPAELKVGAELKSLTKKLAEDEKALAKVAKDEAELEERIEGITDEVAQLAEVEAALEADAKKAAAQAQGSKGGKGKGGGLGGVVMDEAKAAEYEALKAEAAAKTAADKSTLASLSRQQDADRSALAQLAGDAAELGNKQESDLGRLGQFQARLESLGGAAAGCKAEAGELEGELAALEAAAVQAGEQRRGLEAELGDVQKQLREVKSDRQQSKQEEKMAECLLTLKRLFPGVKGRLLDLCKPVQRKYDTAVTVAAGKHMDAIVVDTQATGYDCIQYMREHRVGVAAFVPLEGLKTKELNERLRNLGPHVRLVADVVECSPEVRPAVQYAVENTVVCDTLDAARDLCFRRNEKVKAVTLDGSVISKAGTMTGGKAPQHAGTTGSRWDASLHADLKAKRDALLATLAQLGANAASSAAAGAKGRGAKGGGGGGGGGGSHAAAAEIRLRVTALRNKEQYAVKDIKVTKEKMAGLEKSTKVLAKQLSALAAEREKLGPQMAARRAQLDEVGARIAATDDAVFAAFSRSLGVANVREFEAGALAALKETAARRGALREQRAKLSAQLDFERAKDFKGPRLKIEKRIGGAQDRLKQGEKRRRDLAKEEEAIRKELRKAEEVRDDAKNAVEEKEIEVKALQQERSACSTERVGLSKKATAAEVAVEQLRGKLHAVLQKARVEEVDLPLIGGGGGGGGGGEGGEEGGGEGDTASQVSGVTGSSQQSSRTDGTSASTHLSQRDSKAAARDKAAAGRVDFSGMKRHRNAPPATHAGIKKGFEDGVVKLRAEIEQMQPNMKAAERFEDVSSRHKSTSEQFDQAREDARDATELFNEIKQKRHEAFMACFSHISDELQAIYKDLTKSSKHPLGGNAYLSLDDTEEPYLAGIKYNAMPPMKRFRDMDQLSGGEKTVAALAFLFSIHSFRPAPFFVMDEVDAALDNVNVKKVCNYIKQRSKKDFQIIAISLKDIFYEQADSLVGICRDVGTNSSRTLTLDLEQFD